MSKAILLSIKPKWVAKILNGEKTIEIRKTMPKCDLPIDVYIYCSKGNKNTCLEYADNPDKNKEGMWCITKGYPYANGKVVAKFTVRKVNKIRYFLTPTGYAGWSSEHTVGTIIKNACLTPNELAFYLSGKNDGYGYAYHIEDLVIFDKPKELSEFYEFGEPINEPIMKAPQNFMYIESEE